MFCRLFKCNVSYASFLSFHSSIVRVPFFFNNAALPKLCLSFSPSTFPNFDVVCCYIWSMLCFCCSMLIKLVCWLVALVLLLSRVWLVCSRVTASWFLDFSNLLVNQHLCCSILIFAAVCLRVTVCLLDGLVFCLLGCDLSLFWSQGSIVSSLFQLS